MIRTVHWVNVKDRLPEEDVDVIIFSEDQELYYIGYLCIDGWVTESSHFLLRSKYITHWMKLPYPPMESDDSL